MNRTHANSPRGPQATYNRGSALPDKAHPSSSRGTRRTPTLAFDFARTPVFPPADATQARSARAAAPSPVPRPTAPRELPANDPALPRMETLFGMTFADVRLRSGPAAAQRASTLDARAYTDGRDVGFASDLAVGSEDRKRALAHELAHVAQARGGTASMLLDSPAVRVGVGRNHHRRSYDEPALIEAEAESAATAVLQGRHPMIAARSFQGLALWAKGSEQGETTLRGLPLVESVTYDGSVITYYFNIAALQQHGSTVDLPLLAIEQYIRDSYPTAENGIVRECKSTLQAHWLTKPVALNQVPAQIRRVWIGLSSGTQKQIHLWFTTHHPELKVSNPAVTSAKDTSRSTAPQTVGANIGADPSTRIRQGPEKNRLESATALKSLAFALGKGVLVFGAAGLLVGAEVLTAGQVNWILLGLAGASGISAMKQRRQQVRQQHADVSLLDSAIHAVGDVVGSSEILEGITGRQLGTNKVLNTESRSEALGGGIGNLLALLFARPTYKRGESLGKRESVKGTVDRIRSEDPAKVNAADPANVSVPDFTPVSSGRRLTAFLTSIFKVRHKFYKQSAAQIAAELRKMYNGVPAGEVGPPIVNEIDYLKENAATAAKHKDVLSSGPQENRPPPAEPGDNYSSRVKSYTEYKESPTGREGQYHTDKYFANDRFRMLRPTSGRSFSTNYYRLTMNVRPQDATKVFGDFAAEVLSQPQRYPGVNGAKIEGPNRIGKYRDNVVVYFESEAGLNLAIKWIQQYQSKFASRFRHGTPELTQEVGIGVGVGENIVNPRGSDVSFGDSRLEPIAEVLAELPANASFVDFCLRVYTALQAKNINPQAPHRLAVPLAPLRSPADSAGPHVTVEVFTGPSLTSAEQYLNRTRPGDLVYAAEATYTPEPASAKRFEELGGRVLNDQFAESLPDNYVDELVVRFPLEQGRKKDVLSINYNNRAAQANQGLLPQRGRSGSSTTAPELPASNSIESMTELGPHALRYLKPGGKIDVVYWEPTILTEINQLSQLVWLDIKTNIRYRLEIFSGPESVPRSIAPHSGFRIPKDVTIVNKVVVIKKAIPSPQKGTK